MKVILRHFAVLLAVALGAPAFAHHSYAAFDRDENVSVDGVIESVDWNNPHVSIVVRRNDGVTYEAQWTNVSRLERMGIYGNPFRVGDRVVISGAPSRDPEQRIITLLTEVRRPADAWTWRRDGGFLGFISPSPSRIVRHEP